MFNDILMEDFDEELYLKNQEALEKMKETSKIKSTTVASLIAEEAHLLDRSKHLFEEFDLSIYEAKLNIDLMFYEQLLKNLDPNFKPIVDNYIVELYKNVYKIYDHINISPELYGNEVTFEIFNLPLEESKNKIRTTISTFLESNYHNLPIEKRKEKYYDKQFETSEKLISEGVDSKSAVTIGIKTAIIENLLTNIAFPFACWSRIKYLSEDHEYGIVFDQETLVEYVDEFKNQISNVAKIIAGCI